MSDPFTPSDAMTRALAGLTPDRCPPGCPWPHEDPPARQAPLTEAGRVVECGTCRHHEAFHRSGRYRWRTADEIDDFRDDWRPGPCKGDRMAGGCSCKKFSATRLEARHG